MNFGEDELLRYLASFVWPFFRISSMFITVPVFSVKAVPAKVRLIASLLITWVIMPTLPAMPDIEIFGYQGFMVAVQQVALGLTTGFILQMVFSIMLFAGQTIAYSMGLGFASMVDPATGVQVPVIAQLFVISGSLLFLAVDGHLLLIEMLAQSFHTLPVGSMGMDKSDVWRVISWSSLIVADGYAGDGDLVIRQHQLRCGVKSGAAATDIRSRLPYHHHARYGLNLDWPADHAGRF